MSQRSLPSSIAQKVCLEGVTKPLVPWARAFGAAKVIKAMTKNIPEIILDFMIASKNRSDLFYARCALPLLPRSFVHAPILTETI